MKQIEMGMGSAMKADQVKGQVAVFAVDYPKVMKAVEAVRRGVWMPEGERTGVWKMADLPWCVCSQRNLCERVHISTKTYVRMVKIEKKIRCMC